MLADLISTHHPDEGRLPDVLKMHLEQNLLQPYEIWRAPDPRLWVMLEIASDNAGIVDFARTYVDEHPFTRTSTELIFLLEELAQGKLNALRLLLTSDPPADLGWTRTTDPDAFELLVSMRDYYRQRAFERGFDTIDALTRAYDEIRIELLAAVVYASPVGYRVNDAHFLSGCIYWRQGRPGAALHAWRQIHPEPGDTYHTVSAEVVRAIPPDDGRALDVSVRDAIGLALAAERQRWVALSVDRLQRFGHAPYTF